MARVENVYRWLDHTSEAELWIEAAGPAAVLEEAMLALAEMLGEAPAGEEATRRVSLRASDLPALLAEWLAELAFLAETEGFRAERAASLELSGNSVEAVLAGRLGEPQSLVKAVTYHRLEFERDGEDAWHARAVLDV